MKVADMDERAKDVEQVGAQDKVKAVEEEWEPAPAGHAFVQNAALAIESSCFGPVGGFPENFVRSASITPTPSMILIPATSHR